VVYANGSSGGTAQAIAGIPGQVYALSAYAKKNGTESTSIGIQFFDASWNLLEANYDHIASTTYLPYYVSARAPDNTAWVSASCWKDMGNGQAWWDGLCLTTWNIPLSTCTNTNFNINPSYNKSIFYLDDTGTQNHFQIYDNDGLILCDNGDNTLDIKGNIINPHDGVALDVTTTPCGSTDGWYVDLTLSDMQTWAEFQGSYSVNSSCPTANTNLDYWNVSGTLTGLGCNIGRTIAISGPVGDYRLQIGNGGNSHTCNFGMSGDSQDIGHLERLKELILQP